MNNLVPHFIAEKTLQKQLQGTIDAAALFLDISGFTQLSERLINQGKEGAEILSTVISTVFQSVIETVYRHGGFISTFAGDAFTAIFPDSYKVQAVYCADEIRAVFNQIGIQETKFGNYELYCKIGLAYGEINWGITNSDSHKSYYFRGEAINNCARAENLCQKMEIILDKRIYKILSDSRIEAIPVKNDFYKLIKLKPQSEILTAPKVSSIDQKIMQEFLPKQIIKTPPNGEFREIVSVFISFKEPSDHKRLAETIAKITRLSDTFGGYIERVDFGDKGANALVIFGIPQSFENDLTRALKFASEIRDELKTDVRAGISKGIIYTGIIGSKTRSYYGVLGFVVSLSARIMMQAEFGQILTTKKISRNQGFIFQHAGDFAYKGITGKVPTYLLVEKKNNTDAFYSGIQMIGRQTELELLEAFAKPLKNGKFCNLTTVYGDPGIGKSRLVYEFVNSRKNIELVFMQTDNILKLSMNPFKYFLNNYFKQSEAKTGDERKSNFETAFNLLLDKLNDCSDERKQPIINEMKRTKSIIAAQMDLTYENSLYEQLDPKGRYENTLFAYKELFKALSLLRPVIIWLEDLHWLDEDSHKVMQTLCRNIADYPIMITATTRFNDDGSKPILKVDNEVICKEIVLDKLDNLAAESLIQSLINTKADEFLLRLIKDKSERNPFYIEQIILYLQENNLLDLSRGLAKSIAQNFDIPSSITAIIIARIDRLTAELKNIVQIASVCGREVEINILLSMLESFMPTFSQDQVKPLCNKIEDEQLWQKLNELKYIFKHALLQEVIYEMQLKTRLRELHSLAAKAIEQLNPGSEDKYYELAYHYEKAEDREQTIEYLDKAGDWAKKNYHNQQAIECYDRLLKLIDSEQKILEIEYKKIELMQFTGNYAVLAEVIENVIDRAKRAGNEEIFYKLKMVKASLMVNSGNPVPEIESVVLESLNYFRANNQDELFKALLTLGTLYKTNGRYEQAKEIAVELLKDAQKYNNQEYICRSYSLTGIIHHDLREHDPAIEWNTKALEMAMQISNKHLSAVCANTLGVTYAYQNTHWDKVLHYYEMSRDLLKEVGDLAGYAMVEGNIGVVFRVKKEHEKALEHYFRGLKIAQELKAISRIIGIYAMIAMEYRLMQQFDSAMKYTLTVLDLSERAGVVNSIIGCYENMGNIYSETGHFKKALAVAQKGAEISALHNNNNQRASALCYAAIYCKKLGWYKKAVEYYQILLSFENLYPEYQYCASIIDIYLTINDRKNAAKWLHRLLDERQKDFTDAKRNELLRYCSYYEAWFLIKFEWSEKKERVSELLDNLQNLDPFNVHIFLCISKIKSYFNYLSGNTADTSELVNGAEKTDEINLKGDLYYYSYLLSSSKEYLKNALDCYRDFIAKKPELEYKKKYAALKNHFDNNEEPILF